MSRKIGSLVYYMINIESERKKKVSLWLLIQLSEKPVEPARQMNNFILCYSFFFFNLLAIWGYPPCTTRPTEPQGSSVKGIRTAKSGLKQKPSHNSIKKPNPNFYKLGSQPIIQLWIADYPVRTGDAQVRTYLWAFEIQITGSS